MKKNSKSKTLHDSMRFDDDEMYVWIDEFDNDSLRDFYRKFNELESDPTVQVIPVIINSYGGDVHIVLAMRDMIKSSPKPVATIAMGKAMSAGASLLAAGTPGFRFVSPDAYIMIHEISSGMEGKANEIAHEAVLVAEMQKRLFKRLAIDTNNSIETIEAQIAKKKNADWTMTAVEAKKWGLVDHIEVPRVGSLPEIVTLLTDQNLNKYKTKPKKA
jgi:ATP-dependent Clp protease protease subunit